ncbi:unnamed protein product [Rhodiola kirilowii]
MAESAVTSLVFKLGSLLKEESQLFAKIRGDIKDVVAELERMRAFLTEADTSEESDLDHEVWVKQVRNCAYDSEDIIDDFLINIAYESERQLLAYPGYVVHRVRTWKAGHDIALSLKEIKTRFQSIFEGNTRYNLTLRSTFAQSSNERGYNPREDAHFQEEADLVGIKEPKNKLIKMLFSGDSTLQIIPVVGMGGLGKTTLVKQVYDDGEIKMKFQKQAWITFSQTYKIEDLLIDVIEQLHTESTQRLPDAIWSMKIVPLKKMVNTLLNENRYLVVIDDVWSIEAWKAVEHAFPKNSYSSRVILTTRNADVASTTCKPRGHVYNLEPLSEVASQKLFSKKIFFSDSCPQQLVKVSTSILKKCAGLPLAIEAISGVLKDKIGEPDEWDKVNESLGAELEDPKKLQSIYKILALSYNDLPNYLRSCFLYMSIFPEDHLIECTRLIRLWMAEGFVEEMQGRTFEEVGESYLTELRNKSLIQLAETACDGKMKTCRIHDLLREVIIMKARDQNFVAVAKENAGQWPETIRRLSVHNNLQNVQHQQNFYHLRSLLMFEVEQPLSKSSMPILFSGGLKMLTVLDLQGTTLKKFPTTISTLFNLRYLSLKDTQVKTIPSSIGKLRKLETLDLKRTRVSQLPTEIRKLKRLRNLLVYHYDNETYNGFHTKYGFKAPKGIEGLKSLQKLCFVEGGQGNENIVEEVGMLTQLRRLGIIKLNEENAKKMCPSIDKLSNLHALSINSSPDTVMDLNGIKSPPKSLRRLYLNGQLKSFPSWIVSLQRLVKIFLKSSRLNENPLDTLEQLPNLVQAEFLQVCDEKELIFRAGKFQKLKILGLHELYSLEIVTVEETSIPSLEKFVIRSCSSLKAIPSGIEHLSKLSVLDFVNMPHELLTTIHPPRREGAHYNKIQHVEKINSTNMVNGVWETERLSATVVDIRQAEDTKQRKIPPGSNPMDTITAFEDK